MYQSIALSISGTEIPIWSINKKIFLLFFILNFYLHFFIHFFMYVILSVIIGKELGIK